MDMLRFLTFRFPPHRSWTALALLPLLGLALALIGPFGSYVSMGFWARCAHFALTFTVIGFLVLEGAYRLARRFFDGNWPLWASLLFDVGLAAPAALIVRLSLSVFSPPAVAKVSVFDLVWQNLVVILGVQAVVVGVAIAKARQLTHVPPEQPAEMDGHPLAPRLPFALKRAAVLALSSEDHYLRVYTARGEALILMTLAEAVEMLKDGFQVHRSHWVHGGAVRDYRSGQVELVGGLRLPVSRQRRKAFEAWLEDVPLRPA